METEKNIGNGHAAAPGLITGEEMKLAEQCMEAALRHGAGQARVSLSKSTLDSYGMLNGELDKVSHSADRSVMLYVFADRKYGVFSTNMLEERELERFASQAVDSVRMLAEDECRRLPDPSRTEKDALTGRELGLYDEAYETLTPEDRYGKAAAECIFHPGGIAGIGSGESGISARCPDGVKIISEECEYSDSVDDCMTMDSNGFRGRHTETSFAVCSEITVGTPDGRKYSGYWWDSSPFSGGLALKECSAIALDRALAGMNPRRHRSGSFNMIVDRSVSSRLVSPLVSALNSSSIQQESSFLKDSVGKRMFSGGLTVTDLARSHGRPGARLFDSEGVKTSDMDIIRDGTVKTCFTNTYMSLKMGVAPTVEGVSRPVLQPFASDPSGIPSGEFGAKEIMKRCRSGIYVTGFNGGNCNPTTGNFSFGIEGFAFRNGRITHPVREMVITGDMISLWNSLLYAGNDARACTRWQIPTLCFEKTDFSG